MFNIEILAKDMQNLFDALKMLFALWNYEYSFHHVCGIMGHIFSDICGVMGKIF